MKVADANISYDQRIFPITYAGARKIVVKVGNMVGMILWICQKGGGSVSRVYD